MCGEARSGSAGAVPSAQGCAGWGSGLAAAGGAASGRARDALPGRLRETSSDKSHRRDRQPAVWRDCHPWLYFSVRQLYVFSNQLTLQRVVEGKMYVFQMWVITCWWDCGWLFFFKIFFFFSFCLAVSISARELQNEAAGQFWVFMGQYLS